MNVKKILCSLMLTAEIAVTGGTLWAGALVASPSTFDFGWCPADAKVSAEFAIRNTSREAVFLESFRPTCGCTAPSFNQETLASDNETKIGLVFNTRGYDGLQFHKPATLNTGTRDSGIEVMVKGHVLNPAAKVRPQGNGIAHFQPGDSGKQAVPVQNNSGAAVDLKVIQPPADWASLQMASSKIAPGSTTEVIVKAKGSFDEKRNTSATFEAVGDGVPHRFTIAIRTGPAEDKYRPPQAAPAPASEKKK